MNYEYEKDKVGFVCVKCGRSRHNCQCVVKAKPKRKARVRHGIEFACEWVAANDEPEELDVENIANSMTVALIADMHGRTVEQVAKKILKIRRRIKKVEGWNAPL